MSQICYAVTKRNVNNGDMYVSDRRYNYAKNNKHSKCI